ncbi:flagellin FliC [Caldimonas thermodepolymerans]|jgi:Flagellin and related hook-associated proteins|uniref:Flagellin n=1 Tax=Caldimonas thermodepolymerans TaxID=215580 RepID=A0A2S5T0E0_9BURK|nr:flagellin [Caldimonas thermodepolymerans]PPE68464.1 flagellin FliC [Caldimonas thermodepolymerans]QPC30781.1 flagellin FliC [Caldimonas thermodepolymerans]RDI02598.1 flagellin [Caldimonas thermodepolymerans]TCP08874.1 flagellin [Caldimonas thermodepolymerans]UZG43522.1 flagellin [Caldimonas thermodepolymerans]
MPQIINTNIVSLNAQRNLNSSQTALSTAMQRLSSGLRVNSAKDDAAGLAIAERMNAQIRGMNVAIRNANDGISLAQTAEGALGKIGDMLQRMRELAVQSRNATNSDGDRANLQKEFRELQDEIKRTIESSKFNGKSLFDENGDSFEATMVYQVGANTDASDHIVLTGQNLNGIATTVTGTGAFAATDPATILATAFTADLDGASSGIAIGGWTDTAAVSGAVVGEEIDNAIKVIDKALDVVNDQRAKYGAIQNRFENVIANLQVAAENQSAARSRIMDADFAAETAALSRAQILQQAGNAMVAQANQLPQQVLALLQR